MVPDIWYLVLVPVVPVVLVVLLALVLVLLSAVAPPAPHWRAVVDALVCIGRGFQDVSNGTSGVVVGGRVARARVRRYSTSRCPLPLCGSMRDAGLPPGVVVGGHTSTLTSMLSADWTSRYSTPNC